MERNEDTTSTVSDESGESVAGGKPPTRRVRKFVLSAIRWLVVAVVGYFSLCTLLLVLYNWTYPAITGVQVQRRIESLFREQDYVKRYEPLPASLMSSHLRHAVVAAEDSRFYSHAGFDWEAIQDAFEGGARRGGSTISQQLAKNLFLTTHRSYVRKGIEVPLTLLTEIFLPKDRILDIYLNVAEWGDGIYGAEAASRKYFGKGSSRLTRSEAAALAACLPNPRVRRPRVGGWYTGVILRRMEQLGY